MQVQTHCPTGPLRPAPSLRNNGLARSVCMVQEFRTKTRCTTLDQAAVDGACRCGFVPGSQHDRPVVVRNVILPFNFKIHRRTR